MYKLSAKALFVLLLSCVLIAGCDTTSDKHAHTTAQPSASTLQTLELTGCENVIRLTPGLISGSEPHGEAAFQAMAELGIKTVISVDGARPDARTAERYGMRYVHLPIGYDGVPTDTGQSIARALRDLPGPVYIHCHHGLHRGPAAAAYAAVAVEDWDTHRAVQFMKDAGTADSYIGLYESVETMHKPTQAELDAADNSFPLAAELPGLTVVMAEVGRKWDHLKAVRAAGWQPPADHPDIDPPHEALQLHELFAELDRTPQTQARPQDYRRHMQAANQGTGDLEQALREADPAAAEQAYNRVAASCKACHQTYRNQPH